MNRRFRLLAAIGIAAVLSIFMVYTALAGSSVQLPVLEAADLEERGNVAREQRVEFVAVAREPIEGEPGEDMTFVASDPEGENRVLVSYSGSVPDAFRAGRHIVVQGRLSDARSGDLPVFEAQPGSLVTKCPSKFQGEDAMEDAGA